MRIPFRKTIYAVGLFQVGTQTYRFFKSYYNLYQNDNNVRLPALFGGKGEWALITGASEGIGEEYATQLAKNGFNILLISRTKENLDKVAQKARFINPEI